LPLAVATALLLDYAADFLVKFHHSQLELSFGYVVAAGTPVGDFQVVHEMLVYWPVP
jgi:hypothetical protein